MFATETHQRFCVGFPVLTAKLALMEYEPGPSKKLLQGIALALLKCPDKLMFRVALECLESANEFQTVENVAIIALTGAETVPCNLLPAAGVKIPGFSFHWISFTVPTVDPEIGETFDRVSVSVYVQTGLLFDTDFIVHSLKALGLVPENAFLENVVNPLGVNQEF